MILSRLDCTASGIGVSKKYGFVRQVVEDLFVLRFYGPFNPVGSYRAQSIYLTTRLLGRLSRLSG